VPNLEEKKDIPKADKVKQAWRQELPPARLFWTAARKNKKESNWEI
jgi:hypothetical protein